MFETEDFRRRIADAISVEAARNGLARYQRDPITQFLQRKAVENEKSLMVEELKKSAGARRGVDDAVRSAIELVTEASTHAKAARREVLTLDDIQTAYNAKYCRIWPFCR